MDAYACSTSEALVFRGGRPLKGRAEVHAAKNAVLPLLASCLLTAAPVRIRRVPPLSDVRLMGRVLCEVGATVSAARDGTWTVCASGPLHGRVADRAARAMRASVLVMGPLVARVGHARMAMPGGCAIGPRPVDLHLAGLAALGAEVRGSGDWIEVAAPRGLRGAHIRLAYPSVTATENLMMAACLARGRTRIDNAATEPEVVDLAACLTEMGAAVSGAGTRTIRVVGRHDLGGTEHLPIPDRIVAGTLLIAGAITRGEVEVAGVVPQHLTALIRKLRDAGVEVWAHDGSVTAAGPSRPRAVHFRARPHPGFPTDLQPPLCALLAVASGVSLVAEGVFAHRLLWARELCRLGANVLMTGRVAVFRGVERLVGAAVSAPDLRAGAALAMAGLVAEGETVISGLHHIDRGYADLAGTLAALGADVRRGTVHMPPPAPEPAAPTEVVNYGDWYAG